MSTWRWIDNVQADGATQMATDQSILEFTEKTGCPTMRIYAWEPYCISLGHNQKLDSINLEKCRQDLIDVVRRPTGGRAVFHAEELTYSVIFPRHSDYSLSSVGEIYSLISRGLARGIRKLGIPAELQKRSLDLNAHYKTLVSINCFSSAARHEVLVNGKKLIGSAQRRLSWGILQHGSILTGPAHLQLPVYLNHISDHEKNAMKMEIQNKTTVVGEYLDHTVPMDVLIDAVKKGVEEEASVHFVNGELSEEERARINVLKTSFSIVSNEEIPV